MASDFIENVHYYFNERGLMVLTEYFHLQRGYCCGQGCKNCPYNHENVPATKKAMKNEEKK